MSLKYVDNGLVYISNINKEDLKKYQSSDKTIVLLKSGNQDMKSIFTELIKTRLNS